MKKVAFILSFLFIALSQVAAQKDQRTTATRIADLLVQFPAENDAALKTAMAEMEKLGPDGLLELTKRMVPEGKASNAKIEYAIMGYSAYVTAPGRERKRVEAEDVWIKALSNTDDKNLASFFMSMLELAGSNKSVSALAGYLNDKDFGPKAASVLSQIGTDEAGKVLLAALNRNDGGKEKLIQALGFMSYLPALESVTGFVEKGNASEKNAAIRALVEMARPQSEPLLAEQTKKDGSLFEDRENTALYTTYLRNLSKNGFTEEARTLALSFVKNTQQSSTLSRIAALDVMADVDSVNALPLLVKAAYDNDLEIRTAGLALASPFVTSANMDLLTKNVRKASPVVQASIIEALGDEPDRNLSRVIERAAGSKDRSLKNAAVWAIAKQDRPDATRKLLDVLKKGDAEDAEVARVALATVNDKNLVATVLQELGKTSGVQKAELIKLLGTKKAVQAFGAIEAELNSSDALVRKEALAAYPAVADISTVEQQFDRLETTSDPEAIPVIQKALINSFAGSADASKTVGDRLNRMPQEKKHLLFPVLSSIGGTYALETIHRFYKNYPGVTADEALKALLSWQDVNAMDKLFQIADERKDATGQKALATYIRLIRKVSAPQEQKLLLLKKAMKLASDNKNKGDILGQVTQITTFPALAFAAQYLDDPALKQRAAGAVMNIGLSDKSFHGTLVRQWLTKAMNAMEGQDAVYMKKSIQKFLDDMPEEEGYVSLFNGRDLTGWKGLVANPIKRARMSPAELAAEQKKADEVMRAGWVVKDGELIFLGKGDNIATDKDYGDIEMLVDWKIFDDGHKEGDAGIYLRGTPQVQIWDTSRTNVGAQVGSGGLYNNQTHESKPLKVADNKLGEWNHFYIKMVGDRVTVYLNGELVTDNVPLENYWDRKMPLWPEEQIELQAHGSRIGYRDIFVKELKSEKPFELSGEEKKEGFEVLFDGSSMDNWQGNLSDYVIEGHEMVVRPKPGSRGNIYTKKEYGDFIFRFEFKLTPGANNGLGIRTPLKGDAAYAGMEIQILDDGADEYKNLEDYQYHGSVYGVIPARRGFLKPVGEWNYQEVIVRGPKIKVILNGETIVDGDLTEARKKGAMDGKKHPGIFNKKGYIGFLGHGSVVHFRNIRVKEL